jgi:hypothetical protein
MKKKQTGKPFRVALLEFELNKLDIMNKYGGCITKGNKIVPFNVLEPISKRMIKKANFDLKDSDIYEK